MAIAHAQPGDLVKAQPLGPALAITPSHAVYKGRQLELIRLVLMAGKIMPDHKVTGEITLLCLEGRLEVSLPEQRVTLDPGDLIILSGGEPHAVKALDDASALLTISLPAKMDQHEGTHVAL